MTSRDKSSAERELREIMKAGKPKTREAALQALAAMVRADRVAAPTSGGPPPRISGRDDDSDMTR